MRQLALTEIYEAGLLFAALCLRVFGQLVDDFAQVRQALIDLAKLLESLSFSVRVVDFLTPGKIHDMESTRANDFLPIFMNCRRLDESSKDSVRARTDQIHAGSRHMSVMRALLDDSEDIFVVR